jgi:hypothetical protein
MRCGFAEEPPCPKTNDLPLAIAVSPSVAIAVLKKVRRSKSLMNPPDL